MAFSSATVSIGASTKKSDYDRLLDNTQDNKANAIPNTTHRGSNGSDHGFIDQDVNVAAGPTFNGGVQTDGAKLRTKVIPIGDWNMVSSVSVNVAHGIGDVEKIRSIDVVIRPNTGIGGLGSLSTVTAGTSEIQGGVSSITDTNIVIGRLTGGLFDGASFNSTSYNRGWITIEYEV